VGELLDTVSSSRLELSEVSAEVPGLMRAHGLRSYDAVHAASPVLAEIGTMDPDFAMLPQSGARIHTTRARVPTIRRWRGGA
jgi:predicted nucleic acid-binding protein